jgi:hypothetical protein
MSGIPPSRQREMVRVLNEAGYGRHEIASLCCVAYYVVQRILIGQT